jgi:hypothetical protein
VVASDVDAEIGAEVAEVRVVGDVKTRKKNGELVA